MDLCVSEFVRVVGVVDGGSFFSRYRLEKTNTTIKSVLVFLPPV
jgi:hypothetical protein